MKKLEHLYVGHVKDWRDLEKINTKIPVIEQIKRGSTKPTIFAPFMGEFGFFINTYLRYVHYFKAPKKIVCCRVGEESLFPSADEFFYDWNDFRDDKDKIGTNIPARNGQYRDIHLDIKSKFPDCKIQEIGHEISYRFIQFMPIPISHFCEDIECDVVIGPRNRARDRQRNYSKEKWQNIVDTITSKGFSVGVVGQKETSYSLKGVKQYNWDYDRPIDSMLSMLNNCKLFIGTDTGTSHVAAMCGCPMAIFRMKDWSTDFVPYMKQQNSNLLSILNGWDSQEPIIDAAIKYLTSKTNMIVKEEKKKKVCLHIPIHISNAEHHKMFLEKKKLFEDLIKMDIDVVFTLDKCEDAISISDVPIIDMRKEGKSTGIVRATKKAMSYFKERYGDDCFMIRTGQDVKIGLEGIWNHTNWLRDKSFDDTFLAGGTDRHNDIFEVLKEIGVNEKKRVFEFIQGNFMSAPMKIWDRYYNNLPPSVVHYKDDSCMSFMLEKDGGKLEKINKFWEHHPVGYFNDQILNGLNFKTFYQQNKQKDSDIKELLPIYEKYAKYAESIVEFRDNQYISTLALLSGNPKKMMVYNYDYCALAEDIRLSQKEVDIRFSNQDSLSVELEECDLLHLDTFHNYERVLGELNRHHRKVKKFILIHDTTTFGDRGDDHSSPGVKGAISEFLSKNEDWALVEEHNKSNGMMVLKRSIVGDSKDFKFVLSPKKTLENSSVGRKIVFYHLLCMNDYISIHNRIMAKFLSNPFFDDAEFYISVVGDLSDRLLMPKNVHINKFDNMGSEAPAFINMQRILGDIDLKSNDVVGYFHCKGASKKKLRNKKGVHDQDTMESFFGIEMWSNLMSFFLIEHIQEYTQYIQQYGSACVYPVRHLYGEKKRVGSLGNFWWCSGDVAKAICKISNIIQKDRHYYEHTVLNDMLQASDRSYKSAFYVHDGRLDIYKTDINAVEDCIYGYFSNDKLIKLINIDLPYNPVYPAIGIRVIDPSSSFDQIASKFLNMQRFKNIWVGAEVNGSSQHQNVLHHLKEAPCPLVFIDAKEIEMVKNTKYHFIDNLIKKYKNSKLAYSAEQAQYKSLDINGFRIIPTQKLNS